MSKHLRILIDARPLVDPRGGGVRCVTEQAIRYLFDSTLDAEYFFVTTGYKKVTLPEWITSRSNTWHIHINWPNKLWTAMSAFGIVALDAESAKRVPLEGGKIKPFDKVIIFNLGFTGFLETPYALLLHDLSFLIHSKWFTIKTRIWHLLAVNPKELVRRAQQLFSVSETTARDAERIYGIPAKEIEVVKPGTRESQLVDKLISQSVETDDRRTSSSHALRPTPYALVLGGGNPRKNVPTAIKAFEILKRDPAFSNLELVVIGKSKKNNSNPTPYALRPTPSDQELDSLYANASVFLYPSWYEGYGLPLHEAARFNTPCISSTDGALPETAPQGTLFVPPSKPHLWSKAIRDVLASPEHYQTTFDPESEKPDFKAIVNWLTSR